MQAVEIAPTDVLKSFSPALRELRSQLTSQVPLYKDVKLSQIAAEAGWWIDDQDQLFGRSWMFGLLSNDRDGVPDETTIVWNGQNWDFPDDLNEVHIDDPWVEPHTFGGAEPVPGDESGKDQRASTSMSMESIRSIVRNILVERL